MNTIFNKCKFVKVLFFVSIISNGLIWAQSFPVSVKDGKGNKVVAAARPERIISLGAASTEILYAVGAENQIAAVSNVSNYPEEAMDLPQIGDFGMAPISVEKLLSYEPDLVILYSGMHDYLIPSLDKYKIPYYVSDATSVESVITEIKAIAILTGHKKTGESLEKRYREVLKTIKKQKRSKVCTVYWEVWNNPYMSAGKQSFINDVIKIAGGKNIFGDVEQGYPVVSEETIIASSPDVILIPGDNFISADSVKARKGWADISAVKNDKVIIFNADIYTRAGPRIFDAILELNDILYN